MDIAEHKELINRLGTLLGKEAGRDEELPPQVKEAGMLAYALLAEFFTDVKRIADAAETRNVKDGYGT